MVRGSIPLISISTFGKGGAKSLYELVLISPTHPIARGGVAGEPRFPTQLSARVVKGGRLKICCVCFVGSNPTSTISTFFQKVEPSRLASIPRLVATITAFIVRSFVRLAQSAEHRSYEPKVGSSILPANTFGAACGAINPMWSRWL